MKKTIFFCMLLCVVSVMNAQFSQVHVGVAFPSGDFGEYSKNSTSSKPQGMAATGFNLGYKYYSPLSTPNLSLVFGLDIYYHGLQSDYKDDVEEFYDGLVKYGDIESYDLTLPSSLNIPVTGGLNYSYPFNETVKIYGELALGLNYSLLTNYKLSYDDGYEQGDDERKFDSVIGFTYSLEGGLFIKDKYTIGLRYNNLGSYDYKDQDKNKMFGKKLPITNIALVVGMTF